MRRRVRHLALVLGLALAAGCGGGGGGGSEPDLSVEKSVVLVRWRSTSPSAAGYAVHWGRAPGAYTDVLDVGIPPVDAGGSTAIAVDLEAGFTYYFAVTARSADERESGFSNEIALDLF